MSWLVPRAEPLTNAIEHRSNRSLSLLVNWGLFCETPYGFKRKDEPLPGWWLPDPCTPGRYQVPLTQP